MQIVKKFTSSSEFVDWIVYLDSQINGFHRQDYFLAQIAAEIRRGLVTKPLEVKIEDFLLTFETVKPKYKTMEQKVKESKLAWGLAAAAAKRKNKLKENKHGSK